MAIDMHPAVAVLVMVAVAILIWQMIVDNGKDEP